MFVLGNFVFAVATILDWLASALNWLIIARAILSWVNPDPYNAVVQFLIRTTEPFLAPFRRMIPAYSVGIDFSPIFALIALWFVKLFFIRTLFTIAARLG
jgi:YggT family protein